MSTGRVLLVDDEPAVRRSLERLLALEGFAVEGFGSAAEILARIKDDDVACLILDIAMPGLDGLEVQRRLAGSAACLSIVFLTGHGDIPMSVRAIKDGAVDFLTKPVRSGDLLAAVRAALDRAQALAQARCASAELRERFIQLTPREREVFEHVIAGKLNKVIADRLGISEQTVKVHRGRVMEKLGVGSVAELVRAAHRLGILLPP